MSAEKIGIIAGNGELPKEVIIAAQAKNISPFLVALKGIADDDIDINIADEKQKTWCKITSAGKIINYFKSYNVETILFAGGMSRPPFASLIPDREGLKLLNRVRKLEKSGDNALLKEVMKFMEDYNFTVIGADEIADNLLAEQGLIAGEDLNEVELKNIAVGKHAAEELGKADIGQAVIVRDGKIVEKEDRSGTAKMIERFGASFHENNNMKNAADAVLVKMIKPNQDRRIDLPAIGTKTIEMAKDNGIKIIAVSSGNLFVLEKEKTILKAKELGISIIGI